VIDAKGVALRVAEERKLRGWTQVKLAREAHLSLSLVKKVESGHAPASPAFVSACARALGTGVADLLDQPYARTTRTEVGMHSSVASIRRELAAFKVEPPEDTPVRPLDEIAADVARTAGLRHAVDLARLLAELRAATSTRTGAERERAFGLLAEVYAAAGQVAYKLGYVDLSSLAVERYEWAAAASGDELAVLAGDYQRAGELIGAACWSSALRFLEKSRSRIESRVGGDDAPLLSMWGNLHLKSGLAAARAGDRQLADSHLAEARETARRIGRDRDDYRLCFGPTNVGIWSVALAVEAVDGTEAVKRAEAFTIPPDAPRERVGHHFIDLARAHLLHGDRGKALRSLQRARRAAPDQTRYHPMVHETVRSLARQDKRSTEDLRRFAAWCGVAS
jgi:transcriptional regulator with XRE-family HTH domain